MLTAGPSLLVAGAAQPFGPPGPRYFFAFRSFASRRARFDRHVALQVNCFEFFSFSTAPHSLHVRFLSGSGLGLLAGKGTRRRVSTSLLWLWSL